jgi:hypothetical protein
VTIQRAHETTSIEATRAEPTRIAPVDGVRVRIALPWVGTAGPYRSLPEEDVRLVVEVDVAPAPPPTPRHVSFGGSRWLASLAATAIFALCCWTSAAVLPPSLCEGDCAADTRSAAQIEIAARLLKVTAEREAKPLAPPAAQPGCGEVRCARVNWVWDGCHCEMSYGRVGAVRASSVSSAEVNAEDAQHICDRRLADGWWTTSFARHPALVGDYDPLCGSSGLVPFAMRGAGVPGPEGAFERYSEDVPLAVLVQTRRAATAHEQREAPAPPRVAGAPRGLSFWRHR